MRMIVFALTVLTGSLAWAAGNFPETNSGQWQGVGVQIDGQEWSLSVDIGATSADINYESAECGGKWNYLKVTDERIMAVENLSFGVDVCLDGGLVKIERFDENSLLYSFYDQAGVVVAKAVLIEGEYNESRYKALRKLTLDNVGKGFIKGPDAIIKFGDDKT